MTRRRVLRWGNPPAGVHNTPIYLGLERGTFGPSGAAVEIRDNLTGADYTEALVAGEFDMGHAGTPVLFAALARTDAYTIVGQALVRTPSFYLVAPPEVSSMRDLAGKPVAINKLRTCPHSIVRTLLRREGMAEQDVEIRTLVEGWRINEAIGRGEVAAAVNWEPYVSHAERAFGWRVLAEGRAVIVPSNYGFCLYARRKLVAHEPALVRQMIEAYSGCVRYAAAHPEEAARTLYGKIPNIAPEDIDRAVRREAPNWAWDTTLDRKFLTVVLEELKAQEVVTSDFALEPRCAPPPEAA